MKKSFNQFNLPTSHLTPDEDYIPPRSRVLEEGWRRHFLPHGTVLLEQQATGIQIAHDVLGDIHPNDDESVQFSSTLLGTASINSSWYTFGRKSDVVDRRLTLPRLGSDEDEWHATPSGLLVRAQSDLADEVAGLATAQMLEHRRKNNHWRAKFNRFDRIFGRQLGNAGLTLACIGAAELTSNLSEIEAQKMARNRSLATLSLARTLHKEIGARPSLAQLADPDSPLAVFWRRRAPDGAAEAYQKSYDLVA